jgi:ribosomal protein S18 acetylase RimI-like enzyme
MVSDAEWSIELLDRSHLREPFDCGEPALNEFLKKYARQNQESDVGRTYVATRPGETRVLGFYTIGTGSVSFATLPPTERKRLPRYPIPTVHIGRLAVDRSVARKGLGETLLMHALERAAKVSDLIAVRVVEVVAKNDAARRFYLRYGFGALLDDPNHLYLSTSVVRKLF